MGTTTTTAIQGATIPIIDIGPVWTGDGSDRQRVADAIDAACSTLGFFYLKNHGIPQPLLDHVLTQAHHFFNLPLAQKQQVARSPLTNCGYIGLQTERLDPSQPWDLKEAFNVGLEVVWPSEPPDFQAIVADFYRHCTQRVAPTILQLMARALGLPEAYFDDQHSLNYFLRLLHYPPVTHPPAPGQLRAGAHTDYGSITLLLQDAMGGLEVKTRDGHWIAAPPIPGTVVVNVGDAMQRWTNDCFSSTPHRVVMTDTQPRSRYSVALFCDPNPDVVIDCLPQCIGDRPCRYPPIRFRDYLAEKFGATY
jgi:isopenicillin N synthase-like dioxygenase